MGNLFGGPSSRVKIIVKELRTGKTYIINVPQPSNYTVQDLQVELRTRIEKVDHPMIIKHNKKDITDSVSSLEEVLELQPGVGTISLILEQVERRGGVSRGWTLHIKTLTGRIFDVEISNPQEVSVLGLKLLIQEESGVKPEHMRLVLDNKELEDGNVNGPFRVKDIPGITNECTIHLVLKNH